jgi:hypothetical protein
LARRRLSERGGSAGSLGQAGFLRRQQVALDDVQRGDNLARAVAQLDPGMRLEAFGPANLALPVHEDHKLLVGVDAKAPQAQRMRARSVHGLARKCELALS